MPVVRVIIVEDHPMVRMGIRSALEKDPGIQVIGEADTGREAIELVEQAFPDILLLDMMLPDMPGIDVARRLIQEGIPTKILVLSAYNDIHFIHEILQMGAAGYLLKEDALEEIAEAVRDVAGGQSAWLSRRVAAQLAYQLQNEMDPSDLTDRQQQVLEAVADGKTNEEIGFELSISPKTVEKHVEKIYKKLHVSTRVEAAVMAVKEGLA